MFFNDLTFWGTVDRRIAPSQLAIMYVQLSDFLAGLLVDREC